MRIGSEAPEVASPFSPAVCVPGRVRGLRQLGTVIGLDRICSVLSTGLSGEDKALGDDAGGGEAP